MQRERAGDTFIGYLCRSRFVPQCGGRGNRATVLASLENGSMVEVYETA